ncbi:DUF1614 domain-containing protein [Stygiolobus caldivivus]|uniref:Membrane protein n=1 Tax=Stygiolobus caldivivus TaxID=2824673 RepID=A0A8D5U4X1_9CREN|nr:DUF1614 domain-containing protein [Stygiolobus caldivivus]BCU68976.1 membrane protein [Stygiolobus caldivivus]
MSDDKPPRVLVLYPVRGVMALVYTFFAFLMLIITLGYFAFLFKSIGINDVYSLALAFSFSFLSFVFSPVNLVLKEINREALLPEVDVIYVFGIPVYVPRLSYQARKTLVAINIGGAIIPVAISSILLFFTVKLSPLIPILVLVNTALVTLVSNRFSRVLPGVGVVMNPLIAPVTSSLISLLLFSHLAIFIPISAYISSVLGTLIGADLLNMKKIIDASPQIVSIGGMGTFDGIFLSGVFSIILGEFFLTLVH